MRDIKVTQMGPKISENNFVFLCFSVYINRVVYYYLYMESNSNNKGNKKMTKQEKTLQAIAIRTLNVQTLKVQNSDSLDFHTLSVWEIKAALKEAYAAGQKEGGAA